MKWLGIAFREQMLGVYFWLDSPGVEHRASLDLEVQVEDLARFAIDPTAKLTGTLDAEGLASARPVRGTVEVRPLAGRVAYELAFEDDRGASCRLYGEKEVDTRKAQVGLTTLPGSIFREDREIARVVLRMPLAEGLVRALRSIRWP